ncbi:MAG: hypothetical protein KC736_01800 [Candidatus Moranbacteria bacterium]|nr:hypothetical protein [Candidatus Moranbacteria bacterium]
MSTFFDTIFFLLSVTVTTWVVGYSVLLGFCGSISYSNSFRFRFSLNSFSSLESFFLAFPVGFVATTAIVILVGNFGVPLSWLTIALSIFLTIVAFLLLALRRATISHTENLTHSFEFTKKEVFLFIGLLLLTVVIKTTYLSATIFPTSTDLGHHMYWSQEIVTTSHLPVYQEQDVVTDQDGTHRLSQPEPIADFIIGEHIIFAVISFLSGTKIISAFPSLFLMIVNLMSILVVVVLALRLFLPSFVESVGLRSEKIALAVLFLLGPVYAISGAQEKFVSGGVIGNLLGNLLIPTILYFFLRALRERRSDFLSLGVFVAWGLFYTHHLSGFVFLYVSLFVIVIFWILSFSDFKSMFLSWIKTIFSAPVMLVTAGLVSITLFVYAPSYITTNAVETAVGGPSKATRAGLSVVQFIHDVGEPRMVLAVVGGFFLLGLLIVSVRQHKKIDPHAFAVVGGWTIATTLMTLTPQLLSLDIPSNRIANYAPFPYIILAGLGLVWIGRTISHPRHRHQKLITFTGVFAVLFLVTSGMIDNGTSLKDTPNTQSALMTFHASSYLAQNTSKNDIVLKDHNYTTADAWIKLFFTRGYNFPLSRSLFGRYEDPTKPREQCTRLMISTPNTLEGQKCRSDIGVTAIMVEPRSDASQFSKGSSYEKIYANDDQVIFTHQSYKSIK